MELQKPSTKPNPASRTVSPSPYYSPQPTRRVQKPALKSGSLKSATATPEPQLRKAAGKQASDPALDIGIVSSETSRYYLVRTKSAWVSIMKGNLLAADSSPLPANTPFAEVKLKKVKILEPGCYTSCALIIDAETFESVKAKSADTERIAHVEDSENQPEQLLENYERLAVRLMTDVVALSRLIRPSCEADGAREFLCQEKQRLSQRVKQVVEELEQLKTSRAQEIKQIFLNLLHNLNDRAAVTCENCHVAKYDVRLSCGHKYCGACQHKLVQTILSGNSLTKCFLCRAELTKVDQKLVALEQYHRRQKSKDNGGAETSRSCSHMRRGSQGTESAYRCYVCHCCVKGKSVVLRCPNCDSMCTSKPSLRPREKD